jgi:hypothetical protein
VVHQCDANTASGRPRLPISSASTGLSHERKHVAGRAGDERAVERRITEFRASPHSTHAKPDPGLDELGEHAACLLSDGVVNIVNYTRCRRT